MNQTMLRSERTIHIGYNFDVMPLATIAPDLQIAEPGGAAVAVDALVMVDQFDQAIHAYVLDADAKHRLVEKLTGGLVIPTAASPVELPAGVRGMP